MALTKRTDAKTTARPGDKSAVAAKTAKPAATKPTAAKPTAAKPATAKKKVVRKRRSNAWTRAAFAILVTLAVLALAFFLVVRDAGQTSVAENAVGSLFAPVQNAISTATRYIRDVVNGVKDYVNMQTEFELARQENSRLKLQMVSLEEDALENARLTELLGAQERYEAMDPIYAKVIGRDPGVWFDTFTINRGTFDGISTNMAVVTGDGLVGRVFEVGLNYAKVLSVIDTRSSVACLIERTRDNGVMSGQTTQSSTTSECRMRYLPVVNDIVPGDVVVTSGVDMLFPKGIQVGTVAAVSRQTDISDKYIVVLPSVDFLHIEEVLVLRTVVETEERLSALPTPTPRPTPTPAPTMLSIGVEATPEITESPYWQYPTPLPESYDGVIPEETPETGTPTPAPTEEFIDSTDVPLEDEWAR